MKSQQYNTLHFLMVYMGNTTSGNFFSTKTTHSIDPLQSNCLHSKSLCQVPLWWQMCTNLGIAIWRKSNTQLTNWGRVTHTCAGNLTIIGSDNGLSPVRRQAIIWTNAVILLTGPWGTSFSEIWTVIQTFSFKKMHLKMSSGKRRPFCLSLNVLTQLKTNLWPHQQQSSFVNNSAKHTSINQ